MSRGILFVALLVCLAPARPARAQDSNYWTNKYGTRSILLNGAVIGGPVDLSAMYYNPGGLALLKDPGTVLTVKAFAFSNISLPDAGGKEHRPRRSALHRSPDVRRRARSTCAFWEATRWPIPSFRDRGCRPTSPGRALGQSDVLPAPGLEQTYVEARLEQDLDETWAGLTWSRKLSEHVGIGFSPYVAVRSQRTRAQVIAQAMGSDSTGAVTTTMRGFQYSNYGLLAKAGISLRIGEDQHRPHPDDATGEVHGKRRGGDRPVPAGAGRGRGRARRTTCTASRFSRTFRASGSRRSPSARARRFPWEAAPST